MNPGTSRYGIKAKYWDQILGLLHSDPGVKQILLFGSRAKGNFKPGSDLDLCLKGAELTERDLLKLRTALDALDLPWRIDLIHYESLSDLAVKEHVDRVGIILECVMSFFFRSARLW